MRFLHNKESFIKHYSWLSLFNEIFYCVFTKYQTNMSDNF